MLSENAKNFLKSRRANPKQKEFFEEHAEIWDEITIHDQKKVSYIFSLLKINENDSVLDVGTGTGVMIPFYLDKIVTGKVTAIDFSEKMIAQSKKKYPEEKRLSYRVLDIYESDYENVFDKVVCYSCFPHFPDPLKAIGVLARAVKKDGFFIIAHSSSKDEINNVHTNGGEEICMDYLPDSAVMKELFRENGLDVVFSRDDEEYFIVIGKK